jgi:hypothetical protein
VTLHLREVVNAERSPQKRVIRMGPSQTSPSQPNSSGLDLEKDPGSGSRQNFFWTCLLIELIALVRDV